MLKLLVFILGWLACAAVALAAIILARKRIANPASSRPHCASCKYDLSSTWYDLPRCPECGQSNGHHPVAYTQAASARHILDIAVFVLVLWAMCTLLALGVIAYVFSVLALAFKLIPG